MNKFPLEYPDIDWFTCLKCEWQIRAFKPKTKKVTCVSCGGQKLKWRSDDEQFFQKARTKLLKKQGGIKL